MTTNIPQPSQASPAPGRTSQIRDLSVERVGYMPRKIEWVDQEFPLHAVGFVVSGHGTYRVNGGPEKALGPGCAFSVFPGPVFTYGPAPGTTWEEYYVCLTGRGIRRWIECGWFPVDGSVHLQADRAGAVEQFRELMRVVKRGQPGDADRAVVRAEDLLLELYYGRVSHPGSRSSSLTIDGVLNFCREHFAEFVDFQALARRHAMSYSLLRQRMKQITGAAPAQYLTRLRCDVARALLSDSDLSVKEIGVRVGVDDPYTFSRTFKKCVGVSPVRYRQQTAPWHG